MEDSHLYQVLRVLTAKELREFGKFLAAPVHNSRSDVQALFQYLKTCLQKHVAPDAQIAMHEVLEEGKSSSAQMHLVKTYLLRLLETWLIQEEMRVETGLQSRLLARAYRHRQLPEMAARTLRRDQEEALESPLRDSTFFENAYENRLELLLLSEQKGRAKSLDLQELTNAQDLAFVCEKLQNACLLLSHQAVSQKAYQTGLLDAVLAWLGTDHDFLKYPSVAAWYHGYFALQDENGDAHFAALKDILIENHAQFSMEELRKAYLISVNFCIKRLNRGQTEYIRKVFEIYKSGLAIDVFLENGNFSRFTFNNIAAIALNLQEYDWVRIFLEDYKFRLQEVHREATFSYNMARYFYQTRQFAAAQEQLQKMEYDDVLQNLTAKTLLAKIYFEMHEWMALDSILESISAFARRNKGMGYHRNSALLFVRFLRKVASAKTGKTATENKLFAEISAAKGFSEKAWLLGCLKPE
jgi:hypothetical protein